MLTVPDMSFGDHIKRLIKFVSPRDRSITTLELRFYYLHDLHSENNELYLEEQRLLPMETFERIFLELCTEGREWINISATSPFSQTIYGVACEYSNATGREKTAVNISGPIIDREGHVRKLNLTIRPA